MTEIRGQFLIDAARKHAEGEIALHVANIRPIV